MEINIYLYNFDNFRMHNKCDYHIYLCIRLGFNLWKYMFFLLVLYTSQRRNW